MKFAIISVTDKGRNLANEIKSILNNDPTVLTVDVFHKNVKKTLETYFNDYDCWIGIMATGIIVRSVCSLLKSKLDDPAVLVIGENSRHVISLLSGHVGGANQFAIKIAGIIGAVPVLTTATDLQGKMGVDTLAYQYWLEVHGNTIGKMNNHLAGGGKIDLCIPQQFRFLENHPMANQSYNTRQWNESFIRASLSGTQLDLHPLKMVVGVGSKKGVTDDQVFFAIRSALQLLHLPVQRLDALATAEIKKDEDGINAVARKLGLPLEIISLDKIKNFIHPDCASSQLVMREFGIKGVSEPAALIGAGLNSRLILKKTAFNGVTVAVAVKTI